MVNDLPSVTFKSKVIMYADDTVLIYSAKHVDELEYHLNKDLDLVNNWVQENGLTLNPNKTQFMIFGTPQKLAAIPNPVNIKLESHTLSQVKSYKYLGVHLDPALNWKEHVYHTSKKISSRLSLMSRLKKSLPLNSLKLLANSLVLPLFDYCSIAWSKCPSTTKDIIVRQHKRMARIVLGVDTRTSTDYVLSQLNWTTIEDRWKLQRCKLVYRALNGDAPEYLSLLFQKVCNTHNYQTRSAVSDGLIVTRARTNAGKQSFSYTGALEWNSLPINLRHAPSKHSFSAQFWRALHCAQI